MNELKKIENLYLNGKLFEDIDEKGSGGYWDLAGELANELVGKENIAGYQSDELHEQLQDGFYQVFKKVLIRGEKYN